MLSARQRDFMRAILPRITIVEGCISSGKTFICNLKATEHITNNYRGDGLIFFIGRTLGTLEKNVLTPLYNMLGDDIFTYNIQRKQASLCGIRIDLEGCNDIRAEAKIRGTTAEFVYGDELTLWNREFMVRCMGSLRTPSAVFLGTTNPDTPLNFVKTDYLDRADELNLWNPHLTMDDNPSLTEEYKRQVSKEYVGVLHDRFIKGLWVQAEGLIYPNFSPERHMLDTTRIQTAQHYISVDYGTLNPFSAGLWGKNSSVWYRKREYYHDGRQSKRQMTDEEYYAELEKLAGDLPIQAVIVDPSAASFIACIRKHGRFRVLQADNSVLDGIRNTATALQRGDIMFDLSCEASKLEFQTYRWDEKSTDDKPIKEYDHAMDEIRYFVQTVIAKPQAKVLGGKPAGW